MKKTTQRVKKKNALAKPHAMQLRTFADDRGVFVPAVEATSARIKRIYYISNYGVGVIRGFHFHKKEWKYFFVVSGAAKFIALNPKDEKKVHSFTSSPKVPQTIVIPPGYANGWVSLEENTILVCASTSSLSESLKDDVRFDPYTWGDLWSVKGR